MIHVSSRDKSSTGLCLWHCIVLSRDTFVEVTRETWPNNAEVAIHVSCVFLRSRFRTFSAMCNMQMCLSVPSRPQVHRTGGSYVLSCYEAASVVVIHISASTPLLLLVFQTSRGCLISIMDHVILKFPATALLRLSARVQCYQMTTQGPPSFLPTFPWSCAASRCFPRVLRSLSFFPIHVLRFPRAILSQLCRVCHINFVLSAPISNTDTHATAIRLSAPSTIARRSGPSCLLRSPVYSLPLLSRVLPNLYGHPQ